MKLKTEIIEISPPYIRLDQLLKFAGLTETGGHSKEVILAGLVKVNGLNVRERGKKIYPGDQVEVEDYRLIIQIKKDSVPS